MTRRFAATLAVAAGVCLIAAPAHASLNADFNGDGVPDRIVLPSSMETHIVVRVSGSTPQVLEFPGRLVSIVATDIDHDGDVDLSALTERRGVLVWLNKGGLGLQRLLKRGPHRRGRLSLAHSSPLASAPKPATDRPLTQGDQDDRDRPAHADRSARLTVPDTSAHVPHLTGCSPPSECRGVSSSRAPPSRTA
jgi:hypothetical protein